MAVAGTICWQTAMAQDAPSAAGDGNDVYQQHVEAAKAAAIGVGNNILNLCNLPEAERQRGDRPAMSGSRQSPASFEPAQAFDNFYYVGLRSVSAWVVETSDGLILIDALNEPADAERTIIPAMQSLGLDPADIKYLVITHGHRDHYGASTYFAEHYGTRLLASDADWELMAGPNPFNGGPQPTAPKRDMTITDGQELTLGDTTLELYITPGHTPGTVSPVLPLNDNGTVHRAILWGGTGFNFEPAVETFISYADSAAHMREIADEQGVDVLLSNHGFVDGTPDKLPAAASRADGEPNPFVVGTDEVVSFMTVAEECARARAAAL